MNLAFALFDYFPFGGLQRDFLRIAQACSTAGHQVTVYTMSWQGLQPPDFTLNLLPSRNWQNHQRNYCFATQLLHHVARANHDLLIGFNKLPNLDLYYAADSCYYKRIVTDPKSIYYRWLPRYRYYLRAEQETLNNAKTHIFFLAQKQCEEYCEYYHLSNERYQILPPNLNRDILAHIDLINIRAAQRSKYGLSNTDKILLLVASSFKTKGLDRILLALAALPGEVKNNTRLWVVGDDKVRQFWRQAKQLNIAHQVDFFGGQDHVEHFMCAADLLVHPAYQENTGTVLLEALVNGLPILTLDSCGYAQYVTSSGGGISLPEPFNQQEFNYYLQLMLTSNQQHIWQQNGLKFATEYNFAALPVEVLAWIEQQ